MYVAAWNARATLRADVGTCHFIFSPSMWSANTVCNVLCSDITCSHHKQAVSGDVMSLMNVVHPRFAGGMQRIAAGSWSPFSFQSFSTRVSRIFANLAFRSINRDGMTRTSPGNWVTWVTFSTVGALIKKRKTLFHFHGQFVKNFRVLPKLPHLSTCT